MTTTQVTPKIPRYILHRRRMAKQCMDCQRFYGSASCSPEQVGMITTGICDACFMARTGDTPERLGMIKAESRLWQRVEKRPNGCWEWQGRKNNKGYGVIGVNGTTMYVHRFVWEFVSGAPIGDKHVLHRCDNPICVNPAHLAVGAAKDNIGDMWAKGRQGGGFQVKQHCVRGHLYDQWTQYSKGGKLYWRHGCSECKRHDAAMYRIRHRAEHKELIQ